MADSDDYGFDDIVLDDQALALLDQEEQKYLHRPNTVQNNVATPAAPEGHVNKRHKTTSGWTPGIGANVTFNDAYDDLPEISLRGDGSYDIGGRMVVQADQGQTKDRGNRQNGPVQINTSLHRVSNVHTSVSRPYASRQAIPPIVQQKRALSNENRLPEYQGHVQPNKEIDHLQAQMADLQKKLDEMHEGYSKLQLSLKASIDVKLAKEGEVSILRRNIEKASQNHAAQLLQLKMEKEKIELKQTQMQKDMKDELERLRSQMVFKQQELDSSMRRVPTSIFAKKTSRDFPSTPLAVPPFVSAWTKGPSQAQSSKKALDETPIRAPRFDVNSRLSPSKQPRKSPEKARNLPGFQNAFETSTPVSLSKKIIKEKRIAESDFTMFDGEVLPISYASQSMDGVPDHTPRPRPPRTSSQALKQDIDRFPILLGSYNTEFSQANNDDMDVAPTESDEDAMAEEVEVFQGLNWKAELCRVILTHCHSSTGQIALQHILGCSGYTKNPEDYMSTCSRILEVISNSNRVDDLSSSVEIVCKSLLYLSKALQESQQLQSLAILLDLMQRLVLSLPISHPLLLSSHILDSGHEVNVIDILCRVILENLEPTQTHIHKDELALQTISLLQLLTFKAHPESIKRIESFAQNHDALLLLLHTAQPTWFLEKAAMLLVLLSTHHVLYSAILGLGASWGKEGEPIKNSFIDRLCLLLMDSNRLPTENFKIYILMFLAQLSVAHPDAFSVLIGSSVLIPSLVSYISQLCTPLWEETESVVSSADATACHVKTLNQAIYLLYHLIFRFKPCVNLRHKLQHAPHRHFPNITHVFIVSFGRISFCEPPGWIEPEVRQEIEFLNDLSQDILELVIDGPEGESVWMAFQLEPDDAMDEDQMEASLIGEDV